MLIKSLRSVLLTSQLSYRGRHFQAVSVGWAFRLSSGQALTEQQFWQAVAEQGGIWFDEARAKDRAEFLVVGQVYPPPGCRDFLRIPVSVRLGARQKSLLVSGDRHWEGLVASRPEPFEAMPLVWERSFGGKNHEMNPLGKGADPNAKPRPLPNLESPDEQMLGPDSRPRPVNLTALPVDFPGRQRLAGTPDPQKDNPLELAPDLDWRFFNVAPEDQRFEGYLAGDESYELFHLHPSQSCLRGRLPGVLGRAFALQRDPAGGERFREIPLKLDTVWFFPNQDMALVLLRGTFECQDRLGRDVLHLMCAHESLGQQPRSLEFYQDQLARRIDVADGFKYTLLTAPLLPEDFSFRLRELLPQAEREDCFMKGLKTYTERLSEREKQGAAEAERQARQQFEAQSPLDPDMTRQLLEGMRQAEGEEPEVARRMRELMERLMPGTQQGQTPLELDLTRIDMSAMDELAALLEQQAEQQREAAMAQLRAQRDSLAAAEVPGGEESAQQLDRLLAGLEEPPVLQRPQRPPEQELLAAKLEMARNGLKDLVDSGQVSPEALKPLELDLGDLEQQLAEADGAMIAAYRQAAHFLPPSRSPHPGEEPERVARLRERHRAGEDCADADIAFGELVGADLAGLKAGRLFAEFSRIRASRFRNADLSEAIFAHAELGDCDFEGARLEDANLGSARLTGVRFSGSLFRDATFGKSRLENCCFEDCQFEERGDIWLETQAQGCLFLRCRFRDMNFIELAWSGCQFLECEFENCHWVKCRWPGARFDKSRFRNCNWIQCDLNGAGFGGIDAPNIRFLGGCNLERASFRQARLAQGDLGAASLCEADLGDADLSGANLGQARMHRALLAYSQADGCNFRRADLMEGNLMGASLKGADFSEANLYASNFLDVTLSATRFTGANLDNSLLQDWRP